MIRADDAKKFAKTRFHARMCRFGGHENKIYYLDPQFPKLAPF